VFLVRGQVPVPAKHRDDGLDGLFESLNLGIHMFASTRKPGPPGAHVGCAARSQRLAAHRLTTLSGRIQASGGARPRTEDSGQTAWCSRSIGVTQPMTRATGRNDHTMPSSMAPRLLVIRRTTSSKSALS